MCPCACHPHIRLRHASHVYVQGDIGTSLIYVFSQTFKTIGELTNQSQDQLRTVRWFDLHNGLQSAALKRCGASVRPDEAFLGCWLSMALACGRGSAVPPQATLGSQTGGWVGQQGRQLGRSTAG